MPLARRYAAWGIPLIVVAAACLVYMVLTSGYAWSKHSAIMRSAPFQEGATIYSSSEPDRNVIVWRTADNTAYAKVLASKWGKYRVLVSSQLAPQWDNPALKRTWATFKAGHGTNRFVAAVQEDNPAIATIIVSNDNIDDVVLTDLNDIRSSSTLYMELTLDNGYAAGTAESPSTGPGGIVFRELDRKGRIVSVGR